MKDIIFNCARKLMLPVFFNALLFSNVTFAVERNICGTVSKADVSKSGDMLRFSVKHENKKEQFNIYIEDEAMKYSDLIWRSFEKKTKIFLY